MLNLFELQTLGPDVFQGVQPDMPNHHIVGGQIAAQALMAASLTAPQRPPNSVHVYFLRQGDARVPVRYQIARLRDGGTFSARRITASQQGRVLMEGLASFTAGVDAVAYQCEMPDVPTPESLVASGDPLVSYAEEAGGWWVDERPFDIRYVDSPPRIALDEGEPTGPVSRIWLRVNDAIPSDPVLSSCVLTLLSALTPLQAALGPMGKSLLDVSALLDHTVWFHRPPDFSDWLFYEQDSPTGIAGRALATGTIYNCAGDLVCTASQEGYFPPPRGS